MPGAGQRGSGGRDGRASEACEITHKKNRLEAFSDGVFAIAITLMVLEIAVPGGERRAAGTCSAGSHDEWPVYLTYFVSFMTIGAVWIEHSAMVDALDYVDGIFMRLNLVLLLFCAFLPFPTRTHERVRRRYRG